MVTLLASCKQRFLELTSEFNEALVYLDEGTAEFVHLSLGTSFLYGLGVTHVCKLEDAKPSDACLSLILGLPVKKLVILVSQLLTDAHQHIVRAILAHADVTNIHILCAVTEHAHSCLSSTVLSVEAYTEYSSILRNDLQDAVVGLVPGGAAPQPHALAITVKHLPTYMCILDSTTFVLPAAGAASTLARSGGRASGFGPAELAGEEDGEGGQGGMSLMAHALAAVAGQLGLRPHAFALGPVSQQIGHELSTLPPPPGAAEATGDLAVLLMDRSLDMATPALHHDHILDAMLAALPRRPAAPPAPSAQPGTRCQWRPVDVRCELPGWFPLHGPLRGEHSLLGAELFRPEDSRAASNWEQLAGRRGKDATMYIRKWLKEALRQEKLQPSIKPKMGPVSPAELANLCETLVSSPAAALEHQSIVTLGFATASTLSPPHSDRWEAAAALERQLLLMVSEVDASAAQTLADALRTASEAKGPLQVGDVLSCLLAVYSIAGDHQTSGPFSKADEATLRTALTSALATAPAAQLQFLGPLAEHLEQSRAGTSSIDPRQLHHEVGQRVSDFFSQLHYVAAARGNLKELRRLSSPLGAEGGAAPVVPLLRQLLDLVLQRQELQDVVRPTSALRGLLSMGLGRFGLQATSTKPGDFPTLLLFVVGGLSVAEVRELRQEMEVHPQLGRTRVLIAGTALLTPEDVVRQAFS